MLVNTYFKDIEQHKNKLRIDIAWYKKALFEAIYDKYDEQRMIFLQQEIILKEHYLKELNINNFERVSSPLHYKPIKHPSILDLV